MVYLLFNFKPFVRLEPSKHVTVVKRVIIFIYKNITHRFIHKMKWGFQEESQYFDEISRTK